MGLRDNATLHFTDEEMSPRGIYCIGGRAEKERMCCVCVCVIEREREMESECCRRLVSLLQVYVTGLFYIMTGTFSKDQFCLTLKKISQDPDELRIAHLFFLVDLY